MSSDSNQEVSSAQQASREREAASTERAKATDERIQIADASEAIRQHKTDQAKSHSESDAAVLETQLSHEREAKAVSRGKHLSRAQLAAFVFVVITSAAGFWMFQRNLQEMCENSNESRTGIREFLEELMVLDEDGITPDEKQVLAVAERRFAVQECPPVSFGWS